jgi:hypothetical protein
MTALWYNAAVSAESNPEPVAAPQDAASQARSKRAGRLATGAGRGKGTQGIRNVGIAVERAGADAVATQAQLAQPSKPIIHSENAPANRIQPKGGHPSLLTQERHEKIIEALTNGCYISTACQNVGVSEGTYQNWMNWGAQLFDEFGEAGPPVDHSRRGFFDFWVDASRANMAAEAYAMACLHGAMEGDWRAAAEYMKMKAPEKYSPHRLKERYETTLSPELATKIGVVMVKVVTEYVAPAVLPEVIEKLSAELEAFGDA